MKKFILIAIAFAFVSAGCGTVQSIIKSSFPYTATLVIPASSATGTTLTAMSEGTSFDQNFAVKGNNGSRVSDVHIVSAKMTATIPSDFNIGNLVSAKIYMAKANGESEVLVASRTDIGPNSGPSIVLDIDNTHFLDELVREKNVRIRMVYQLRNKINIDASLRVVLGISADPAK
ncbi:hypothetical protein [Mucilaginibacter psychrotolerans]|uniref:Uncharacterized protein n=1 Tax=Mucilaginibacter psychrotolerans TaxID=1524096 RepID=A0A4Y8SBY7_9SPHI|nr:hypothetical protein [Mucilaginibacter psychrotolerans]TFF36161.1 hypothetical protein E2R66_16595 [Mucilaginibacter psychrotolerans]